MDQEVLNALSKSALKSARAMKILVFSAVLFAISAGVFFLCNQALPGLLQGFISCGQLAAALILHWRTRELRSQIDGSSVDGGPRI